MLRKILLLLPIVVIVLSSGCTQSCIIPIPGLCGGHTTEYEHDVIVIKSLEALPNKVSPGQQIKLRAYIENRGNKNVEGIQVSLYDHCGNLFSVSPRCPDNSNPDADAESCTFDLLPHQIKSVEWTLVSSDSTKLKTECDLKIYARYAYVTDSITSVTFINYQEYQKQLDEGTFHPITSYITEGYGPIKPYITVEDTQPIPVEKSGANSGSKTTVTIGVQLKNRGSGFLACENNNLPYKVTEKEITSAKLDSSGCVSGKTFYMTATKIGNNYDIADEIKTKCLEKIKSQGFTFIKKETPKIICSIDAPTDVNLPKQSTIHVTAQVAYAYEFRKDIKVTIEPKT